MFLLRSAFWLTLAFIVMAPPHVDLTQRADARTEAQILKGRRRAAIDLPRIDEADDGLTPE